MHDYTVVHVIVTFAIQFAYKETQFLRRLLKFFILEGHECLDTFLVNWKEELITEKKWKL